MSKIKRDTTKDLFFATLKLVKENGHYDKAEAIMDYHLLNNSESNVREDIELSNYRFDFNAMAYFGCEGIFIDCFVSGDYTETERKVYNHNKGITETETQRHIGTFKTLRRDINSFKIMGELCGALIYYAHQYVDKNIGRYTPAREFEQEENQKREVQA